jgi:hypothetical protein
MSAHGTNYINTFDSEIATTEEIARIKSLPVSQFTTSGFVIEDSVDNFKAIVEGVFSAPASVAVLGDISGSVSKASEYEDGSLNYIIEYSPSITLDEYISIWNPTPFLSGNDVFEGSKDSNLDDMVAALEGNDVFIGYGSTQAGDYFVGGGGVDTAVYRGNWAEYTLEFKDNIGDRKEGAGATLKGISITDSVNGRDGLDYLIEVERLHFSDRKLALDVAPNENAALTLQFINVIASGLINDLSVRGLILSFFDQGYTLNSLYQLGVDRGLVSGLAGGSSNEAIAQLAYRNLFGTEADTVTTTVLAGYVGSMGQAGFLAAVAGLEDNQQAIGLTGLQETGIEYI